LADKKNTLKKDKITRDHTVIQIVNQSHFASLKTYATGIQEEEIIFVLSIPYWNNNIRMDFDGR